eukprot:COSAG01_NODE_910_length_12784_cov_15.136460_10_plen_136_part_00
MLASRRCCLQCGQFQEEIDERAATAETHQDEAVETVLAAETEQLGPSQASRLMDLRKEREALNQELLEPAFYGENGDPATERRLTQRLHRTGRGDIFACFRSGVYRLSDKSVHASCYQRFRGTMNKMYVFQNTHT